MPEKEPCTTRRARRAVCNVCNVCSAIEFLLIAKENETAMQLAREHDMMESLALFLGKVTDLI